MTFEDEMKRMRRTCAIAVTVAAVGLPSLSRADTAADQAAVELEKTKFEFKKSQVPTIPDKSLTPGTPSAPSLNATADRFTYALTVALAKAVVDELLAMPSVKEAKPTPIAPIKIVLDDGKARGSIATYKSVTSLLEVMRSGIDARKDILEAAFPPAVKPLHGERFGTKAVPLLAAAAVVGGVVQAVVGFTELFKTQYGFQTLPQKDAADTMLAAAVASEFARSDVFELIDFGASSVPCVDLAGFPKAVGGIACPVGAPTLLANLRSRFYASVVAARSSIHQAGIEIGKAGSTTDIGKDILAKRGELQTTLDEALKAWVAMNATDASGNASIDVADRGEALLGDMARGRVLFLTTKVIAADADVVVDTRWYTPLHVSMESVAVGQWRVTNAGGKVVGQGLLCRTTSRAKVALRGPETTAPTIQACAS